jgi:hypothetical protein
MGLSDPKAGSRTRLAWNSVGPVSTTALALGLVLLTLAPVARAERLDDPIELGSIDTPRNARSVSVVGGLAYVADGPSGLRVIQAVPEPRAFWLQLAAGTVVFAIYGFSTRRRTVVN